MVRWLAMFSLAPLQGSETRADHLNACAYPNRRGPHLARVERAVRDFIDSSDRFQSKLDALVGRGLQLPWQLVRALSQHHQSDIDRFSG